MFEEELRLSSCSFLPFLPHSPLVLGLFPFQKTSLSWIPSWHMEINHRRPGEGGKEAERQKARESSSPPSFLLPSLLLARLPSSTLLATSRLRDIFGGTLTYLPGVSIDTPIPELPPCLVPFSTSLQIRRSSLPSLLFLPLLLSRVSLGATLIYSAL